MGAIRPGRNESSGTGENDGVGMIGTNDGKRIQEAVEIAGEFILARYEDFREFCRVNHGVKDSDECWELLKILKGDLEES